MIALTWHTRQDLGGTSRLESSIDYIKAALVRAPASNAYSLMAGDAIVLGLVS